MALCELWGSNKLGPGVPVVGGCEQEVGRGPESAVTIGGKVVDLLEARHDDLPVLRRLLGQIHFYRTHGGCGLWAVKMMVSEGV